MSLVALTSLSPSPAAVARQRFCLESWKRAGLDVVSLNHPSEHAALAVYGVDIATAQRSSAAQYGRHLVPINEFSLWIARSGVPALIINADDEMRASPAQVGRMAELAATGVPCSARVNHDSGGARAITEPCGYDVFVLSPRHLGLFTPSFLSLGQPWWDYWVPWEVLRSGEPLWLSRSPLVYHRRHRDGWDGATWDMGAVEFSRLAGMTPGSNRVEHVGVSARAYAEIAGKATVVDL